MIGSHGRTMHRSLGRSARVSVAATVAALVMGALGASGCASTTGFQSGSPGRAYIVDAHNYLVTSDNVVWSCDATTGSPQCWRVVERE